ncbi:MAG: DUF2147 domain-containing protein [Rhizobiales bacterium]|nr:DUF2147 domain-containing protein [Hyphomicrobiales bacterium]
MKKFYILAALFFATTSAHAGGISFQYEGKRITIDAPRGCASLSCINITAPGFKGLNSKNNDDDDDDVAPARREYSDSKSKRYNDDDDYRPAAGKPGFKDGYKSKRYDDDYAAAPARSDRAPPPAPAPAPATDVPPTASAPAQTDVAPPAPAPAQVAVAAPAPQRAPEPTYDPNSPIGVWAAEDNKGNVRIEECGGNLCGYAEKSGEKVLINMKPQGSKWAGRIQDPDSGKKYDATIAMKSNGTLRVQGCAFGGMFCGGQTWKRVS